MKPIRVRAAAMAMALILGLSGSALAGKAATQTKPESEGPEITVQLDGKKVNLSKTPPVLVDGITYLPYQAAFKAVGARVKYDKNTNTVTATRNKVTVTMDLGGEKATVTQNKVSHTVEMEEPPYTQDGETYLPIRFVARVYGCAIGWDQDNLTVLIVDTAKLAKKTLSHYKYTYLDKLEKYLNSVLEDGCKMRGEVHGSYTAVDQDPVDFEGSFSGAVDTSRLNLSMSIRLDIEDWEPGYITEGEEKLFRALRSRGLGVDVRGDLSEDQLYLNLNGETARLAGINERTWYAMGDPTGPDYAPLLNLAGTLDPERLLAESLKYLDLKDQETFTEETGSLADSLAKGLDDEAFSKSEDGYGLQYEYQDDAGGSLSVECSVSTEKNKVTEYSAQITHYSPAGDDTHMTVRLYEEEVEEEPDEESGENDDNRQNSKKKTEQRIEVNINTTYRDGNKTEYHMSGVYVPDAGYTPSSELPSSAKEAPFRQLTDDFGVEE